MPGTSPGMTEERGARSDDVLWVWVPAFRRDDGSCAPLRRQDDLPVLRFSAWSASSSGCSISTAGSS
jgi:hypothetical protein